MESTAERLRQFRSEVPSQWREHAEARLANREERREARKFAMRILNALDSFGMSGEGLAEKLSIGYDDLSPILKGHKLPSEGMSANIRMILHLT